MPAIRLQIHDGLLGIFRPNVEKDHQTLQALRLKLKSLNQACISSKSIMQLTKTIFSDSDIFIEKKTVEIGVGKK